MTEEILVFKTNIRFKKDLSKISLVLQDRKDILQWNVDLEDIDKVLRIESIEIRPETVIKLIEEAGFLCEELPD